MSGANQSTTTNVNVFDKLAKNAQNAIQGMRQLASINPARTKAYVDDFREMNVALHHAIVSLQQQDSQEEETDEQVIEKYHDLMQTFTDLLATTNPNTELNATANFWLHQTSELLEDFVEEELNETIAETIKAEMEFHFPAGVDKEPAWTMIFSVERVTYVGGRVKYTLFATDAGNGYVYRESHMFSAKGAQLFQWIQDRDYLHIETHPAYIQPLRIFHKVRSEHGTTKEALEEARKAQRARLDFSKIPWDHSRWAAAPNPIIL